MINNFHLEHRKLQCQPRNYHRPSSVHFFSYPSTKAPQGVILSPPPLGCVASQKPMVLKGKLYITHIWTVFFPLNAQLCSETRHTSPLDCNGLRFRITSPCSWTDQSEHIGRSYASLHLSCEGFIYLSWCTLTFRGSKLVLFRNRACGPDLKILSCLDPLPYARPRHSLHMRTPPLTQSPHH